MRAHCSPEIVTNNNDTSVELFDGLSHTVDHLRERENRENREGGTGRKGKRS